MSSRGNFVKSEVEKIYNNLNVSYEYAVYSRLENERQFIKIFELLMMLSEKSNNLRQVVSGSLV